MTSENELGEVFVTYVRHTYEAASARFLNDPSSNNWIDLKMAMWAWQRVQSDSFNPADAAHHHLKSIAAMARGDDNFGEPE